MFTYTGAYFYPDKEDPTITIYEELDQFSMMGYVPTSLTNMTLASEVLKRWT